MPLSKERKKKHRRIGHIENIACVHYNADAACVVDCMSLALDRRELESAVLALDREKCVIFLA